MADVEGKLAATLSASVQLAGDPDFDALEL
jgi:hypothetical protein